LRDIALETSAEARYCVLPGGAPTTGAAWRGGRGGWIFRAPTPG
jgi:hypothetical protein